MLTTLILQIRLINMIDATASPLSHGLLSGTITNFGSFDQCLAVKSPTDEVTKQKIAGKYCVVKYALPLPPRPDKLTMQTQVFNFKGTEWEGTFIETFTKFAQVFYERFGRFGVCVPSTCTKRDIQQMLDFGKVMLNEKSKCNCNLCAEMVGEHVNTTVSDCTVKEEMKLSVLQTLIIALFTLIALLLAVGTFVEILTTHKASKNEFASECLQAKKSCLMRIILCFSIITNGRTLLSTKTHSQSLEAINGVKALSMAWILLTHTYLIPIKETFAFARSFMDAVRSLPFQVILNGWVLVDSFFVVGALLVTYSQCRVMHKSANINYIQMILHRLFRLSPMVWFTVLLLLLIPQLGSGPLWKEYFNYQEGKCRKYWWSTILYINNWFTEDKMCLLHTWYLSADFQMFLFSLFFVHPMLRRPKLAMVLIGCTVLGSSLSTAVMTYWRSGAPTVIFNTPSEVEVYKAASTVYTPTVSHVGPYFIGVLLGFLLFQNRNVNMKPLVVVAVWSAALFALFSVLLSTYFWNSGYEWSPLSASLYAGFHRVIWASSVGWVCFACLTGNGGPINKFLSWKMFVPLSRMSLSIYLMHFLVIWVRFAYLRELLPFSHYTLFCEFVVNYIMSIVIAAIAYLAVEAPFDRLIRSSLSKPKLFSCFAISVNESKANNTSVAHIKYLNDSIIYRL
ncbi:Nose resistant to fluoxetine protein 6-like protein [Leptotrombidium deliense]|uniref:Nose resistant to fluoxetine protein 6-like protein n=1 Tax=Leptotrombidium deliense TaxID=299467 RepID=A0A443SU97_9ACAR|nr:Nose resistant to fluoxetine protein 6-like protein [Leptotrombidium deliense]